MMLLGSLLPDIDVDGAVISRPGGIFRRFMPWGVARVLDGFGMIISKTVNLLFGHRGFIHAPIIGLALIGYGAIAAPFCFWLGWGYFWHIAGDALTYGGVPLLSPVSAKKYSFRLCRTGSIRELLLAITLLFYMVTYGFQLLPEDSKAGFRTLFHTHFIKLTTPLPSLEYYLKQT